MSSSSKFLHFSRRDGGVVLLVGVFVIGALILFGAGCKKSSPPPDAGPEVRDPNGAWRTYLPQGYELEPLNPDTPVRLVDITDLTSNPPVAAEFAVKEAGVPPRWEAGPPLVMTIFPAPPGSPPEWYASVFARWSTTASPTIIASLEAWSFEDNLGMVPVTFLIGRKGSLGFEIKLSGFRGATSPSVEEYLVDHLEPL